MELKITKEAVLKAANTCQAAKDTLTALFPEAFECEPFDFGDKVVMDTVSSGNGPLFIGVAYAPAGLKGKCLMMNKNFTVDEVTGPCGYKGFVFYKK